MKPKISIIAAIGGEKRALGDKGKIPWHISEDFKRFKSITSGHPIIMGRKTFESIGRPLPNRTNIVITREDIDIPGCIVVHSVDEAIEKAKNSRGSEEIFIIGGGQIYQQVINRVDKLYLTVIEGDFSADTFFPDYSQFKKVILEKPSESEGYKYKFLELEKS